MSAKDKTQGGGTPCTSEDDDELSSFLPVWSTSDWKRKVGPNRLKDPEYLRVETRESFTHLQISMRRKNSAFCLRNGASPYVRRP